LITPTQARKNCAKIKQKDIEKILDEISKVIDNDLSKEIVWLDAGRIRTFILRTIVETNCYNLIHVYLDNKEDIKDTLVSIYSNAGWCVEYKSVKNPIISIRIKKD